MALFCSMFCASEIQALPPGADLPTSNISKKRKVSESRRLPQRDTDNPSEEHSRTGVLISEPSVAGLASAKEEHESETKKKKTYHNILDQEEVFWAEAIRVADAAEAEHLRRQQTPTSLTPPVSSQGSLPSQQASLVPSPGKQAAHVNPYNSTPEEDAALLAAVIAIEEKYSQDQLSQSSPSPITHGQESCASQTPGFPSPASESDPDEDSEGYFEGFRYWHLTTPQDHQHYLIDAINSAERSILITSYTLSADMTGRSDLFKAMRSACYRGVRIYLYANEIRLGDKQLGGLKRLQNLRLSEATIHSKLVVVDNKQITCGSYDWLAEPWRGKSQNATLILESPDLKPEVDNIWHVLKKYRTVDFSPHSLRRVEKTLNGLDQSEIQFDNPEDAVSILNTPYQHRELFEACFEQAQRQLTICTPFITGDIRFLQDILPRNMLRSFLNSGRQLNIFCREGDDKIQLLEDHLNQALSGSYSRLWRNVTVTSVKGLHRKTMFADDDLYIEGSYNWLSSARSLKDPYYYMETSLQFTGTWAQELIREFSFPDEF